jgi:hypothetical protein
MYSISFNRRFRVTHRDPYLLPASCSFLALLTLQPWRRRRHIPPKCLLTLSEQHGVISQKMEMFWVEETFTITTFCEVYCQMFTIA